MTSYLLSTTCDMADQDVSRPPVPLIAGLTLMYIYFASLKCLVSGLPVLTVFSIVQLLAFGSGAYRTVTLGAVALHVAYYLARPSSVLYLFFSLACWTSVVVLSLVYYPILRTRLRPARDYIKRKITKLEERIAHWEWPLLNLDEKGYLRLLGGASVDILDGSIVFTNVDFAYRVDAFTTVLAKLDTVRIRVGRDVALGELSVNLRGHGHTVEMTQPRLKPVRTMSVDIKADSRKLPPVDSEVSSRPIVLKKTGSRTPPVLPPRRQVTEPIDQTEDLELQQAIKESLASAKNSSRVSLNGDTAEPTRTSLEGRSEIDSELQSLYPEEDAESDAYFRKVLEDNAVKHKVDTTAPIGQGNLDAKAAFANQLKDKLEETLRATEAKHSPQIRLRQLLNLIPWWLKLPPGPLLTRLILSPIIWLHPLKIKTVAVSGTGKRITNILERCGVSRAHPDPEIFRLVRKVIIWLERGDVSLILTDIQVNGYVPLARDPVATADIKASRPTAYRNTGGEEDLLAQLEAIQGTVQMPTYLLPNHEAYFPETPRCKLFYSVLLSMPAVFNKELLIIGAAFLKAITMIDMKQDAASRPPPSVHLNGNFSLRGLGTSLRQAAGDIAKQKSVQWGVGSERLAKYVNKISKWMRTVHADVGGKGEIEFDLIKLRRKRDGKEV
ncbi:hypothetical protein BCR37DRAFT_296436 [Protomyces lactucae-debilis]|uniref:Uncharacterized protein n=1 Tax=Protomyces lactucae-debilis TaxID=2754530 RepID=A0A1Y2FGU1_PROLT|nr:uncharacterized protein BCR37DRAFT_296436 [Protomyces lactucae-debilis]ORY83149.1 hypothetical protein BCR37DRAFT_296436 [Protomyces lactucae-debilis]